jgi:2-polyprenyl-3-methyl-5-hydroxy-6-metoxy-1,4-benzoquinol methylase
MATQDQITEIVNYWNSQPCNIKHSNQPVGSIEYFEEVRNKRYQVEPHILKFADFDNWKNKRVLEIGCGIATDGIEFAKAGAEYTGIDISNESIELAKHRFDVYNLPGTILNLDAHTQSLFELGKFDLVYSFGVLHHYPNIQHIINRINKLLDQNGVFKFMVYAKNSWKYAMIQEGLDQFEAQADCPYADVFTIEDIKNLLTKFNIESIEQDHCFMFNIPEYKKGNFVLESWFEHLPHLMKQAVNKHLGWHLLVTASKV